MPKLKYFRKYILIIMSAIPIYILFSQITIFGDDAYNKANVKGGILDLLLYVWHQYFTWSSRIIVNFVMYFTENQSVLFFAIVTSLLFILLIVSLSRIFNSENKILIDIVIILCMYGIPFTSLVTASWIATTTTYLWPAILATYAMTSIFVKKDNYVTKYRLPFLVFATLYAANNEQILIVLFIVFSVEILHQRFSISLKGICMYLQGLMILLNAILIVLCPGNKVRNTADIKRYFPDFSSLSIYNKVDMGIMSTGQHFIYGFNISIILLFIALSLYYFYSVKSSFRIKHLIVSISGLTLIIASSIAFFMSYHLGKFKRLFFFPREGLLRSSQPVQFVLILTLLNFIILALILYSMSMYKNRTKNRIVYELFFAGLLSRLAVCTSATQYASASRTFFSFEFVLLIIALTVFIRMLKQNSGVMSKISSLSVLIVMAVSNLFVFSLILNPTNHFVSDFLFLWLGIFYV